MRAARMLRLALGEAGASPWRSWPLTLGIALGVACLVFFLGLAGGVERILTRRIVGSLPNRIRVQPSSFKIGPVQLSDSIDAEMVAKLRALPGVVAAYRQARLPQPCQLYASYGGHSVVTDMIVEGVDPGLVAAQIGRGKSFEPRPNEKGEYPAVFPLAAVEIVNAGISIHTRLPTLTPSALIGRSFTLLVGSSSFSPGHGVQRPCEIVGVSDQIGVSGPAVPMALLEEWNGKPLTCYAVTLEVASPGFVEPVARAVDELGLSTPGLDYARKIAVGADWTRVALFAFCGAVLMVAGVGIATGLSLQVREEARWIGLYRALGATRGDIRWIYLARAGALGLAGALGGLGLGLAAGFGAEALVTGAAGDILSGDRL
ncbi:MAG: ABC transporter permease, partial [Candidatus Eremiobacterota bacterium]